MVKVVFCIQLLPLHTEVDFTNFPSVGFSIVTVVNPLDGKLVNPTSVLGPKPVDLDFCHTSDQNYEHNRQKVGTILENKVHVPKIKFIIKFQLCIKDVLLI